MHRNARLTFLARRTMVERIAAGRAVAQVAAEMGVSRPAAYKWRRRWLEEGEAGLDDRTRNYYVRVTSTGGGGAYAIEYAVSDTP